MNLVQSSVQNLLTARARLGEGPVWDADQQTLYWVDIYNHLVHQFNPKTGKDRYFEVGDLVSAIAIAKPDQLLLALRDRLAFLNLKTEKLETLKSVKFSHPDTRFNDGKCDPQGRFWIGSISQVPGQAALYRYADGSLEEMETGLTISNGLGWSPDGQTFYLTDSPKRTIYAYNFDGETGKISDRRVFVQLEDESVEPDGLTVDTAGNIWSALWDGWAVVCFNPHGEELLRLKMPVQRPTCPTFGGPQLTDLYITTASVGLSQQEIQQGFYAGDVFSVSTATPGMPTYSFKSGV